MIIDDLEKMGTDVAEAARKVEWAPYDNVKGFEDMTDSERRAQIDFFVDMFTNRFFLDSEIEAIRQYAYEQHNC